ncbi:ArdC family protein [Rudanella lutea]|uniref:ArdC family protein n=1 Tax=Rudanella lutea TaxID=451374 RepID=UPI00036BF76E|nr:zincin-like metallopeptidase domain-containing protein [Rudanella lutea]
MCAKADAKFDVYEFINEQIITQLEKGVLPWRKPWKVAIVEGMEYSVPHNYATKRPYTGVNAFLLALTPYRTPMFLTFNQVKEKGGMVKQGAASLPIVFWKPIKPGRRSVKNDKSKDRSDVREDKLVLRYYRVFNIEDTTLPVEIREPKTQPEPVVIEACQRIVDQMPNRPRLVYNDPSRCYYRPALDVVNMAPAQNFKKAEDYYSVLFHELVHATGHSSRLNRAELREMAPFGSQTYSKEELTAELGAAYLCGVTGISSVTLDNSTAYINGWLNKLRGDKRFFFEAAQKAQKAANYIQNLTPTYEAESQPA